ncbi:MAG: hypothetical protein JRH20_13545 [Deltaproteobacteria bacterium]|nr:hypothetical protein [Deltaproteobacteria bacterium]
MLHQSFNHARRLNLFRLGAKLSYFLPGQDVERDPLAALESGGPPLADAFPIELGGAQVTALRDEAARGLKQEQLELAQGFTLDRGLFDGPPTWRPTLASSIALPKLDPLLQDRVLRLQIERAMGAVAAQLQSWGETGQRSLAGAMADLSTTAAIAAVAGATLDSNTQQELKKRYLAWQRQASASHEPPASLGRTRVIGGLMERIEGQAPRWLRRATPRARAGVLALLREAISKGARRTRETPASAQDSDLLRLACEPHHASWVGRGGRNVNDNAELLLVLLEQTQRWVDHACCVLNTRWAKEPHHLHALLEEQDWVFGDQGDITYETLRPLELLRDTLYQETTLHPLHLALLAPSLEALQISECSIEQGMFVLVGAPIAPDPVEARIAEPLALALASLLLQKLEQLPAPAGVLRFRQIQ